MRQCRLSALLLAPWIVLAATGAAAAAGMVTDKDLVERNGLWFQKSSEIPYTGSTRGLKQRSYRQGKLHGRGIILYESGQLKVEMTYENGKLNGPYKMYFENGRPMMRGTMKNDQREGPWEVFYFNGEKSLHSSGEYRNGAWVGPLMD